MILALESFDFRLFVGRLVIEQLLIKSVEITTFNVASSLH